MNVLDDLLNDLTDHTMLCIASNLTLHEERIQTMSIKEWREHAEWGRRLGRREHFMAVVQKVKVLLRPNAKDKDELDETKFYARSLVEKWPWLKKIDGFQKIIRAIV